MSHTLVLSMFLAYPLAADDGLLHRWQLTPDHIKDRTVNPTTGSLDAAIIGPVQFSKDEPQAILLDGNSKARHRIDITNDPKKADLPTKTLSVEAWVRVDKVQEWGGFLGAMQDNGAYEKGWLLGHRQGQFTFALASKGNKKLTYLLARTTYRPGYWYHLVGTYDGMEQRLYIDGKLQATSKEQSGDIDYPPRFFYTLGAYRDDDELYTLNGRLESAAVFTKALSPEQVAARFKERKDRFPDIDEVRPVVTDWPTYQRDSLRTGVTPDKLKFPLRLAWVHKMRHAPRPAWPEEAKADYFHNKYNPDERVTFDRAFHVVGVGDRIFFGSSADDRVYCLHADTGDLQWSFVTEGPVRLAPTIVNDRVLFGSDDGHVYCLNAKDGSLLWKQRIAPGPRRIPGNERIISAWPVRTGVLIEDDKCHVCAGVFPSQGGVIQATLDVKDGKVLESRNLGVTAQGYLERRGGELHVSTGRNLQGLFIAKLKRLGKEVGKEVAALPADYPLAFIGTADARIGGGDGKLAAFSHSDGKKLWSAVVEGRVYSLAVVRGRLLVSTDKGYVYCFTSDATDTRVISPGELVISRPAPDSHRQAIERVTHHADLSRGYCLLLNHDATFACELARQTSWRIILVESKNDLLTPSRQTIEAAGLSDRVTIHHGPVDKLPYTDYLFNVVLSDPRSREEALRVLRPGGLAIFGPTEKDMVRKKPLDGGGEWTHMYGDPANTACSNDKLVTPSMQLQWFGPPHARAMIDRHHRTSPPLYQHGRLFVPGEDRVMAVDGYNGTILWDVAIPDSRRVIVFRDNSHLALAEDALYVAAAHRCLALDLRTGKTLKTYDVPGDKLEWGYVARVGDLLLGSGVKSGSIRRAQNYKNTVTETHWDFVPIVGSDVLFAWKPNADKPTWSYKPKDGLIINPTITIGKDRIYFIESTNPDTLKQDIARARLSEMLGKGSKLTALDLKTGKLLWSKPGDAFAAIQHNVFLSYAAEHLVVVGSRNSGTDKKKSTLLYDIHVLDAVTGEAKWKVTQNQKHPINGEHGEQERHPVIVGDRLYCEPMAYHLRTGERLDWKWPWTSNLRRGCGTLSASATCVYFRDENIRLFDLAKNKVEKITTETRPGCWINILPVGGLLLVPEASSGCSCNFAVQTSLALIPIQGKP